MVSVKIVVDHIKDSPFTFHINESVTAFPLFEGMLKDAHYGITGDIQGDVAATREYDNIRITGRITAPLALSCSRCLAEFASYIDTNFTLFFRKESAVTAATESELELAEMDLLSSVYSGDEIDLTHEIEEQLAMEIPLKPLCSESCNGLCHECGIDLNTATCTCHEASISMAFSALKGFKVTR
jgi:uncharacterized protein